MFERIEKAKQIGLSAMERIGDYLELIFIEMETRANHIGMRILGSLLSIVFLFLSLIFLGIAVIVTFWDSGNRYIVAWIVFLFYLLAALGCYLFAKKGSAKELPANVVLDELKQDIQLLKEVFKSR